MHRRRELVGRARDLTDRAERFVALRAGELLFHLRERRPDYVMVVHVRTDCLDGIEPHAVDQVEVARRERRRMRTNVVRVVAAAVMVDDEPNVEPFGLLGALPRVAEQARLVVGGEQRRLADVQLRAAETGDGRDQSVEDALSRDDQQVHRAVIPLGQRHDPRQQPALGGRGLGMSGAVVFHVDAEQPGRHDDHVAIACGLKRRSDVRKRVGVAHGDQQVAGTCLDLSDRELGRTAAARRCPRLRC